MRYFLLITVLFMLTGCGQTGSLYLPQQDQAQQQQQPPTA